MIRCPICKSVGCCHTWSEMAEDYRRRRAEQARSVEVYVVTEFSKNCYSSRELAEQQKEGE